MAKNSTRRFKSKKSSKPAVRRRGSQVGKNSEVRSSGGASRPPKPGDNYRWVATGGKNAEPGQGRWVKIKTKSKSPSDTLADIVNESQEIYENDFLPVEEQLIEDATDPNSGQTAAQTALDDSTAAFNRQEAQFERGIQRTGGSVSTAQREKLDQQKGLARATSTIGAANLARRDQNAQNDATIEGLVQTSQGLRGNALAGLTAAAGLENQRNMAGDALKSQAKQNTMSSIATGAGIGFSVGGPVGGAIGAGVGALVSFF